MMDALSCSVISMIINEIEESIARSSLLEDFKMSELPVLQAKCIELAELLVILHFQLILFVYSFMELESDCKFI